MAAAPKRATTVITKRSATTTLEKDVQAPAQSLDRIRREWPERAARGIQHSAHGQIAWRFGVRALFDLHDAGELYTSRGLRSQQESAPASIRKGQHRSRTAGHTRGSWTLHAPVPGVVRGQPDPGSGSAALCV